MARTSAPYPLMFRVAGMRALVVGGGAVAQRKVGTLLGAGASVRLVSPECTAELEQCALRGEIEWLRRTFEPEDVADAALVFAATSVREVNASVAASARHMNRFVTIADDPENSDFHVPASFTRGDVTVAISTGGTSPLVARLLRETIESVIGSEYVALSGILGSLRSVALETLKTDADRRAFYADVATAETLTLLREGRSIELTAHLERVGLAHGLVLPAELHARLSEQV